MRRYACLAFALLILSLAACAGERQSLRTEKSFQREKEDFITVVEMKLEELGRGLDKLIEAAEYSNGHAQTELEMQIVDLVREKSAVGRKLEYLRAADRETWPYMKTDIEEALDDLARLFEELKEVIS